MSKSNILKLLYSFKTENFELALQLADSQRVDVSKELEDIAILGAWLANAWYGDDGDHVICFEENKTKEVLLEEGKKLSRKALLQELDSIQYCTEIEITGDSYIPKLVTQFCHLERLTFIFTSTFPKVFLQKEHFPNWYALDFMSCKWKENGLDEIEQLDNITSLEIRGWVTPYLHPNFARLKNIHCLSIKNTYVEEIPETYYWDTLDVIVIDANPNLKELPPKLVNKDCMKYIDLEN